MALKLTNNAISRLATSLSNSDTSVVLASGDGDKFPALAAGDWFPLTVVRSDTAREIMRATARAGDVLTVSRGQEGTSPLAFSANDRVELRGTAGVFANYLPLTGGAVTGALSVSGSFSANSISTGSISATGSITASGAITQGGYQVWHTGNFNPASKLDLTGGALSGQVALNGGTSYTTSGWRAVASMTGGSVVQWRQAGMTYSYGLGVSGDTFYWIRSGADGASSAPTYIMTLSSSGTLVATGNVGAYSDRKHKRDIRTIEGALELVERLRGVRYVRKLDGSARVGVIAQEVAEVLPEVVGDNGDSLYVDYGNIVAPLIEAVKEIAARVRKLEDA